jgi:hypothetical protein
MEVSDKDFGELPTLLKRKYIYPNVGNHNNLLRLLKPSDKSNHFEGCYIGINLCGRPYD